MKTKLAPWNVNNNNVVILAGKYFEEYALKYGVCINPNEIELIPCRYIAIYQNDTIKYLFEIIKHPLDDVTRENSDKLRNIFNIEKEKALEWIGRNEPCRLFEIKKYAEIGPIINDYISPKKNKPTPLTCGSARYTTYDRIVTSKMTTELKCDFEDDCPEVVEVIAPPPPPPEPEKINWKRIGLIVGALLIVAVFVFLLLNKKEKIVEKEVIVEKTSAPIIVPPKLFFESGEYDLDNRHILVLEEFKNELMNYEKNYPEFQIEIIGFADEIGKDNSNIELSEKRAYEVRAWLVNAGLDSTKLRTSAKGAIKADDPNLIKENRDYKRRVEFSIINNN